MMCDTTEKKWDNFMNITMDLFLKEEITYKQMQELNLLYSTKLLFGE